MQVIYTTLSGPKSEEGWEDPVFKRGDSIEVFETDTSPVTTGLLNADGQPLYRMVVRQPIGFRTRG